VHAIHAEDHATAADLAAVRKEITALAVWLRLERISDG
jgi:hypothetical protein